MSVSRNFNSAQSHSSFIMILKIIEEYNSILQSLLTRI